MQPYISWSDCPQRFGEYWERMLDRRLFPLASIADDLVGANGIVNFGGQYIPFIVDIMAANGKIRDKLVQIAGYGYESIDGLQNLNAFDCETRKCDFIISGPIGPWRYRQCEPNTRSGESRKTDLLISDAYDREALVESLRLAASKTETLLIYRDQQPPTSLRINGPGNATLLCTTQSVGADQTKHVDSSGCNLFHLTVINERMEDLKRATVAQYLFSAPHVLAAAGLKVCYFSEYFMLVMKKAA